IAAITPFNFPLNLVAHKLAPAIATGNPVVLKPSSNAPLTSLMLAEVVARSPLPGGALNVVPCSAGESNQLVTDERIKLITFTGSPAVGWDIKNRAGKKRVVLELGGNAAAIVDKGVNLDSVVKRVAQGAYGNAGQSCIAVQRVYAHQDIYEEFEEKFVKISRSMPVGNPTNPRIVVGPMISEEAAANAKAWIDEAVQGGARVLCGGSRNGAILEPTVLVDVEPNMRVNCEEVFAPVVTLRKFVDIAGAIRMVNQSRFGLQAGIFSNDLQAVLRAYNDLEVGGLIVNDYPTYRIDHMPYGGVKDSGFGREGVRYAMEEMTELKLLAINAM
ncbi:MAG TPA: aldehyde dehydrogenase family protein, partial [Bacteroidota bacterium]|nr:aldehyde dehydrogenase family protein [Bacteroidota bacterium]